MRKYIQSYFDQPRLSVNLFRPSKVFFQKYFYSLFDTQELNLPQDTVKFPVIKSTIELQWNLDLVTLLVTRKTVTKSRVVTKFIAHAYGVSINSKSYAGTKVTYRILLDLLEYQQSESQNPLVCLGLKQSFGILRVTQQFLEYLERCLDMI